VAQVGIGTTNPKAVLDINSASSGILMPRLTTKERLAIENPAQALTVYDLDLGCFTFWHNNQWHCLCGENDVLSPDEDIDDDDDGIRDTDEIANCIANGKDVIFTINEATVPDNPSRTSNKNIDESTGTKYTSITGHYFTPCGVGTWTFTKNQNNDDESVFNNNMDEENRVVDITTPPVGTVNSNKKLYFHFKRRNNEDLYSIDGTFTFSGPPIKPIFCANSELVQNPSNSNLVGPKFKYAFEQMKFDWPGNEKATIIDPNNQTNKKNGSVIGQNQKINIENNANNSRPRMRSLTWEVELPEVSNFDIYTNKTGRSEEGIALRAIAANSNYSFNDNDGIASSLDIDSDNDGIYDVVEAGFKAYDTNGDGILNSNDNGYLDTNNNGMHDSLENLTPKDTNGNGVLDAYELDADGDTCLDVYEAGFTDTDNDGDLDGTGIDNSNGKVTGNTDGYTDPGTTFQNANFCKECGESSEYEYDSGTSGDIIFEPKEFVTIEDENGNPVDVINSLKININVNGEKQIKIKHRVDNGYKVPIHINKIDINITNNTGQVKFSPTGNWPYPIHTNCEITFNGVSMTPGVNQGRLKYDSNILKEPSIINNGYSCEDVNADCN
jgi:hypothetical protein